MNRRAERHAFAAATQTALQKLSDDTMRETRPDLPREMYPTVQIDAAAEDDGSAFADMEIDLGEPEDLCPACDGDGEENRCIDDMCAGQDECIHGDGMIVCRTCDGEGYI